MATKQEMQELEGEVGKLSKLLEDLGNELTKEKLTNEMLMRQNEDLSSLNNALADERDRLNRKNLVQSNIIVGLTHSIAYLGTEIRGRDNNDTWHLCNPASQNFMQDTTDYNVLHR